MKNKAFNFILLLPIILFTAYSGFAQTTDSITKKNNNLFASVQYAGSIGYLSIGVGITNKKENLHNELLYGFVPREYGGPLNKLTYKFSYYPFHIRLKNNAVLMPFNPTFFLAYDIGSNFTMVPSYQKYDPDYYWWSSALRRHIGFNVAYTRHLQAKSPTKLMCYFEVNTNDLYLLTMWDNVGELSFGSIWSFGMGAKLFFR